MAKEFELLGLSNSAGEYNGRQYNNVLLHAAYLNDKISGKGVKVIKVKAPIYTDNPVKLGEFFDVNYDQYRNVKEIVK